MVRSAVVIGLAAVYSICYLALKLSAESHDYISGSGQCHEHIYHRMRSVASKLTPTEMRMLAIHSSGQ